MKIFVHHVAFNLGVGTWVSILGIRARIGNFFNTMVPDVRIASSKQHMMCGIRRLVHTRRKNWAVRSISLGFRLRQTVGFPI